MERVFRGYGGHVRVVPRMIADSVPFCYHPFYDLWIVTQKCAYNKKGSRSLMLFECIQNLTAVSVFVATVKG